MMKLIILDRDGVINVDSDTFIKSPDEWFPLDGSLEAIAALKAAGWIVAVATNQSGIARGLLTEETLGLIHKKMNHCLADKNTAIDFIAWCPHGPNQYCSCRKPQPGLYRRIAMNFKTSLRNVPVVGDSLRDLQAAAAVGALPILVRTGKGEKTLQANALPPGTCIYPDLHSFVAHLTASVDSRDEVVR